MRELVETVEEVEISSPVSLVIEKLINKGFDVFPDTIYCFNVNTFEKDKKYLLRWADEVGFPVNTIIIAPRQGPCPGGGEMYVTDASPYDVEEADSEAWEQTF